MYKPTREAVKVVCKYIYVGVVREISAGAQSKVSLPVISSFRLNLSITEKLYTTEVFSIFQNTHGSHLCLYILCITFYDRVTKIPYMKKIILLASDVTAEMCLRRLSLMFASQSLSLGDISCIHKT